MKAVAGQRVSVKFTLVYDLMWGEISKHALKKKGSETMTNAYTIEANEVIFDSVRVEDSGTYSISCGNEAGEGSADFVLDITPARGNKDVKELFYLQISFFLYSSSV